MKAAHQHKLKHPEDFPSDIEDKLDKQSRSQRKRIVKDLNQLSLKSRPGILERISTCESREAAHLIFHGFLATANSPSQKTINKANRLLSTLNFPLS